MSKAYMQIIIKVSDKNRGEAAGVYQKYKAPFLETIAGAVSKELLIRDEDVVVLNGFTGKAEAEAYLTTDFFAKDIVGELSPLLDAEPEIRIYNAM